MTDETFEQISDYCARRCPRVGHVFLARARVVVDESVSSDEPVFSEPPAPPEIRLPVSDFVELDRRLVREEFDRLASASSAFLEALDYSRLSER